MDETIEAFLADPKNSDSDTFEHVFRHAEPEPMEVLITGEGPDPEGHDEEWHGFFPTNYEPGVSTALLPVSPQFSKRFWKEDGEIAGVTTDPEGGVTGHDPLREVEHRGRACAKLTYSPLLFALSYDLLVPLTEDLVVGQLHGGRYPYGFGLIQFGMVRA